jgi:hypothetical protein
MSGISGASSVQESEDDVQDHGEHDGQQDRGDEREDTCKAFCLNPDVSREPSWLQTQAGEHVDDTAEKEDDQTQDDQEACQ